MTIRKGRKEVELITTQEREEEHVVFWRENLQGYDHSERPERGGVNKIGAPNLLGDRGGTVLKVLCYKSEGRWIDPRWCHWNF